MKRSLFAVQSASRSWGAVKSRIGLIGRIRRIGLIGRIRLITTDTAPQAGTPAGAVAPDLLVVDELGPLEFARGVGLTEGLTAVDAGRYAVACVVVRPALVDEALRRWPDATVVDGED